MVENDNNRSSLSSSSFTILTPSLITPKYQYKHHHIVIIVIVIIIIITVIVTIIVRPRSDPDLTLMFSLIQST